ncbi:putative bifunctional diguanylate cyclase/phosphodiesterase [Massilia jejuensis]|uniref:Bifunctional diguanylate cyclase/phosphodiesterase n=1 Tax=Massilia jejuensis TaxID=648894 RepID=A0ABW0PCM1_9BURK
MNFGPRLIDRYIAAIGWFIPLEAREDAATLTRARNVINAVVMAALSGPFYAFTYHALGYSAAARVILTCCAGMFVAPFLLRYTKSIVVAREAFLCAVFFNFSWLTYAMGGVSAPTAGWMVIPPMVALFLGGFATAMFWLALTCATIVFIHALPYFGIPLPAHPIEDMALLYLLCDIGLYVVIVLFVLLFELTRTQGFVKLQHALDFIRERAVGDALTGGYNRRHMRRLIEDERNREAGAGAAGADAIFSLCLLDIGDFKRINADYGAQAGDLVLREVALCVERHLRARDAFGRYGGAQLLVLLPATTQQEARVLAECMRQDVRRLRFPGVAPGLAVTVSVGVAQGSRDEPVGQTLAHADESLYQASLGGRTRVAARGQAPVPGLPGNAPAASALSDSTRIDPLTGVLSRRVLRDRLGHAMARALRNERQVGLMLLDVNKFKDINDAFGIAGGDAVLAHIASELRACLHVADTIVRLDGDRFIVILEDLAGTEAPRAAAHKILDRLALPLIVGERECSVSLAIGIAIFPAPGCDMDALLERADAAMARAKNRGGNGVEVYASATAPVPDQAAAMQNDLRQALAAGELLLAYQPRIDLASGRLAGVQAMVCWAHPRHGRLEAAQFMPLAAQAGLAAPIGEWALRAACLQNAAWRAAGLPAPATTLQLAAGELAHPGMVERMLATIGATGIEPRCLELEIAGDALAEKNLLIQAALGRLRRAGVRIALAGFGTGGASLHALARLPLALLKLDHSFVARLGQPVPDQAAWALAESVIHMAHRLQLSVAAEGVETAAQLAELRAMGCDTAQGAFLGRPAGPDAIALLLARPNDALPASSLRPQAGLDADYPM